MAIVMICDAAESAAGDARADRAARGIAGSRPDSDGCSTGHFDDCDLTMRDVSRSRVGRPVAAGDLPRTHQYPSTAALMGSTPRRGDPVCLKRAAGVPHLRHAIIELHSTPEVAGRKALLDVVAAMNFAPGHINRGGNSTWS